MNSKKLLLAFGSVALIAVAWFYFAPPYKPPRNYPPLADAEQQSMDVKLFNELSVKGSWPPHYTNERRQELILNMAKQGFEVADLAYQLLDVKYGMSGRHWLTPWEWGAYRHLRDLADRGDSSAQCLAALVIRRWQLSMTDYEIYVVRAAENGQPFCVYKMGGLLMPPDFPGQKTVLDEHKGAEFMLLAAKKGVQEAQIYLMNSYAHGSRGYPLNIGKAKCWFSLAEQADTGATLTERSNLDWLIQQAQEKGIDVSDRYDPNQWCDTKLTDSAKNKDRKGP
ncbi:hypothetical protein U737_20710 [Methylomonas sp. LW13]|uniref:hypothetical protein n=1 Tax=unclassified Methylomonas TaxID=2608980 RepID=UPI00051AC16C|nr:hypothetical protein [Methylomonas sp. LW13]QBC29136.1 hypothetical protein U737_20710 [Methylomonas sp. LW13]